MSKAPVKKAEDTPMIRQYFEVKARYPEAILLYRVGDFYETYADDAVLASKVLGLVETKRSNGDKGKLPMAGFPHHALETYLTKLVRAGYKVAVCDQLEDPALAGRKLVKRGVTELVTPGLALGDAMLDQKENNFLAGLCCNGDSWGVAFLDISTGAFRVAQGKRNYVATLLSSFAPKELLVSRGDVRTVRDVFGDSFYISTLEEWAFVYEASCTRLCKQLEVTSLKGFAVDNVPLGLCSAGAVLVYLEQTMHAGLKNICSLSRIDEDKFVWMDNFTLRNLEIFSTVSGTREGSLVSVMDRCACPMGSRLLRSWLAMPIVDLDELSRRHDIVGKFFDDEELREQIRSDIAATGDLERICARAAAGKISPRETLQLSRSLSRMAPIRQAGAESGCEALAGLAAALEDCRSLHQEIAFTLAPEPAALLGKGDVIASGVNAELDELRGISHGGRDYLQALQERESAYSGIPSLKIGYNSVFGYYIEVRNSYKDKVPAEWIRKQTLVNAERYITQELKEYEEKILSADEKILALETRLYAELVAKVQQHIAKIQANASIVAKVDVLAGFALLARERNYCRPVMDDSYVLDIKAGRHPVIEAAMPAGEEYVPNDVCLDDKDCRIMILTGPNMAGKSALLRQTALIVLMAQAGSFVPASAARIGRFDKIFTRVGASDNISRGESTFMVEMLETSMILHNLSRRSLVLLDEIGRGTSTYDGMSIARAIVEYIHGYGDGAKTLFATHYHELNDLEESYDGVVNYHISVKEVGKQVIFLRKLCKGGTSRSFGIHVARMAGMPREVIESAERTMASLESGSPLSGGQEEPGMHLSLFQLDDPTLSSLRETLRGVDINNLTPLQAFDLIRNMKGQLGL